MWEEESKLVAFVQGIINRHNGPDNTLFTLSHIPQTNGWVGELYVAPEYRKRGIHIELIDAMKNHIKQNGCLDMRLQVMEDNQHAIRSYDHMNATVLQPATVRCW